MPHNRPLTLLLAIVAGALIGIALGWQGGAAVSAVAWMGDLFLNLLKMVVIPLILAAVISGVANLDLHRLGRLGGLTAAYYLATTAVAVLIGLVVVNLIRPGIGLAPGEGSAPPESVLEKGSAGAGALIDSLVPGNLVAAAAETQLLPLILFALALGAAVAATGERARPVGEFFDALNEAMMRLVGWIMVLTPLGVMGLVAGRLGDAGGGAAVAGELAAVGWHVATVLSGLGLHALFLFGVAALATGGGLAYLVSMLRALLTAWGTASSSATLPVTMEGVRENGVDPHVTRLVLPLGSTVNMDGTALYEACAVLFIAQAYGLDLALGQQAIVFVTATLAAIGAAGIPEAGLVTMVIVLQAVGLPLEGIGLLLAVDWFLDRFRTATNVWGDAVGAAVLHRIIHRAPPRPRLALS